MSTTPSTDVAGPVDPDRVGVIVPHDMALDAELWRWAPPDVSLAITREPLVDLPVTVEMVIELANEAVIAQCTRDLMTVTPGVFAYACTSGSFVRGATGEREIGDVMRSAGAPAAITTSGAILDALQHLGATRVAVATPYDESITDLLTIFLGESGIEVVGASWLGLHSCIWTVPYAQTARLVVEADRPDAEAIIVSCTNLPTYDLIAPLELELGKPVVTANLATMWAALRMLGRAAVGPAQALVTR